MLKRVIEWSVRNQLVVLLFRMGWTALLVAVKELRTPSA